jgi:hypothetical protein
MKTYPHRHQGPVLVLGGASNVRDDYDAARKLYPNAMVVGASFAGCIFPEITHIWTQHNENATRIKERALGLVRVHARPSRYTSKARTHTTFWFRKGPTAAPKTHDPIDYYWPDLTWVQGSSGFTAALWARHGLGYDTAILCGVPISDAITDHDPNYLCNAQIAVTDPHWTHGDETYVGYCHKAIAAIKATGRAEGIYSMSGWTREFLGAPPVTMPEPKKRGRPRVYRQ